MTLALVLFIALFGSNLPAPLYERYRQELGLSTFDVALIFATYPIALVATLLAFARLPDRIGRKPVLVLAVAASGLGSVAFAIGLNVAWLFAGRLVAAVAIGLTAAAGPPALVESDGDGDRRRAALVATVAFSLACGAAPLLSGILADLRWAPLHAPYLVHVAACVVTIALLWAFVPETKPRRPSETARGRETRLGTLERKGFAIAATTAGIAWWVATLFVSLLPGYVASLLGARDPALVGIMAMVVFTVSAIAQAVMRGVPDMTAIRIGLGTTILTVAAILAAVPLHALGLVILSAFLAGIAQGAGFLGAQSLVNHVAPPAVRAQLTARFYALTYLLIGIGIVAIGTLTQPLGLFGGFAIVGGFAALVAILTIVATRGTQLAEVRKAAA
jgi:MFS family permease